MEIIKEITVKYAFVFSGIPQASEVSKAILRRENEFFNKVNGTEIEESNADYQIKIVSLPKNENNNGKPLATFDSSSVKGLQPRDKDVKNGFAVMAELKIPKSNLEALNGINKLNDSNEVVTHFVLNNSRVLSLSAVKLINGTVRMLEASVSFSFKVDQQTTLENTASPQSHDFSRFYGETEVTSRVELSCKYLDNNANMLSGIGCVSKTNQQQKLVVCDCSHTTAFAVLLSVATFKIPSEVKVRFSLFSINYYLVLTHMHAIHLNSMFYAELHLS